MTTQQTIEDKRPIQAITWHEGEMFRRIGDRLGTTKIEPYHENGELAPVLWFAIWEGDKISHRVNGKNVVHLSYD